MVPFIPEFAGKMNFYLSAVDDLLRQPADNPTIGLILCKSRSQVRVEYSLRNLATPMGISTYQLSDALPESLSGQLPTIEELEAELQAREE